MPCAPPVAAIAALVMAAPVPCLQPPRTSFSVPDRGIAWYEGEELEGPCDEVRPEAWTKRSGSRGDLFVHADGPNGSGRYWTVTVAFSRPGETVPGRGFCTRESTVGWRTLQRYDSPLAWVDDADADGWPELVLWHSFALTPEPSMMELGLVAWVYELDAQGALVVDRDLSRAIARTLAAAYARPVEGPSAKRIGDLRRRAAATLDAFATGECH